MCGTEEARAELAAEKARHQATREALASLRSAWNAHFETCSTEAPIVEPPTWEQLHDWANAPSGTASGSHHSFALLSIGIGCIAFALLEIPKGILP